MVGEAQTKVTMVGTFACRDGESDAMDQVLTEMVHAAAHEAGVERYAYYRDQGTQYWFFAVMADAESAANHGQTPAMQKAMQSFGPLVDGPPQVTQLVTVAELDR